ncbi:hypothetical protein [Jonesia denitrificans]|uniref:Aromatic ring-opening dioxygenase LigA n=1 Tax=Jonesia denitrificans (strain ATCC 14870 / DSM 20603 / BCRC 15368 / CIP 55.134 / JCM 11481 / NBRC 15587 / NCTC 10816 / Prevot 55134) TaxID=471856 RepID=C7R1A0_JONDD|nr:hypothetical protein [Jonesia denitrificans]ACV08315.1 hypothetical protein Jden_0651 [Jonesia denitrificans DSM 20603]ASE08020.1 aromatic ring-opening dioxygenase LigA [Jonesia denitrificans]QXB42627.1 aromatic ring-opening dioxygenase LigA [Jonesia denitrificans]SQH20295.1 Uncharacterised protein [Jonesia denitrificans]
MSTTVTVNQFKSVKILGIITLVLGLVMLVAGGVAYGLVGSYLKEENITVAGDADNFAGKQVAGPFTAFAQAEIIDKHALAGSNGLTYAELGDLQREASAKVEELAGQGLGEGDAEYDAAAAELAEISQQRTTVMNGSFLRASLFTSVVSFGVSVLVMGTGVLFAIVGFALVKLSSGPNVVTETAPKPTASA